MNDKNKVLTLFNEAKNSIYEAQTLILKEKLQYKALGILQCALALKIITDKEFQGLWEELL